MLGGRGGTERVQTLGEDKKRGSLGRGGRDILSYILTSICSIFQIIQIFSFP